MARVREGVDRMAISGGEATLNRPWLVAFVRALRAYAPDEAARIHVDTNGTLLTAQYLDELVAAGMTDCGIDLKGLVPETFQAITSVSDRGLARRYLERAWSAVEYLWNNYRERVFVGVGIPYNPAFMEDEELLAMGRRLLKIAPDIQVTLLDYRPAFRWAARGGPPRPSSATMARAGRLLRSTGLEAIICQTPSGHLGPDSF
jgi:pyruvate formate lyase activating enzyme